MNVKKRIAKIEEMLNGELCADSHRAMSELHVYAPLSETTNFEKQRLHDAVFGIRFILDLIPDNDAEIDKLRDAMGFNSLNRTVEHAAARIVVLECLMEERDNVQLDELFSVYKVAEPNALLQNLYD